MMPVFPQNLPSDNTAAPWIRPQIWRRLTWLGGIALAYFAAAKIGLLYVLQPEGIAGIWPAGGVALAAFLLTQRGQWPALIATIFAANLLSNLTSGNGWVVSMGFAAVNTFEPVLAGCLVQRFLGDQVRMERLGEVVRLAIIVALANAVSALLGALVPALGYGAPYGHVWQIWWTEDSLGALIVVPLIFTWLSARKSLAAEIPGWTWRRGAEFMFLLAAISVAAWLSFGAGEDVPLVVINPYMVFPLLIWAAVRFRPRVTAFILAVLAVIALGCTTEGLGTFPLGGDTRADQLIRVQLFLYIASLTGLTLAVVLAEFYRAEEKQRQSEGRYRTLFEHANDAIFVESENDDILDANPYACQMMGYTRDELLSMKVNMLRAPELREENGGVICKELQMAAAGAFESVNMRRDGTRVPVEVSISRLGDPGTVFAIVRDITERKLKEEALRKANQSLARAQQIGHLGSWEDYLPTGELRWSDEMYQILGFPLGAPISLSEVSRCLPLEEQERFRRALSDSVENGTPYSVDYKFIRPDGSVCYIHDEGTVVCNDQGQPEWMYGTTQDITERKQAEEERQRQLERLEALREIDKAVTGSLDLNISLDILLKQVLSQLKVDAADVLLYDPGMQSVNYARGLGFNTRAVQRTHLAIGQGYAGRMVQTREKIILNPLPDEIRQHQAGLFFKEGFAAYLGIPLIAKSQVKGVLELFHRSALTIEPGWLEYLELLSGQAAIAIESIQMFENLQQANMELKLAYDTTIEGWSRALDLRDKETEGHSRRVMEMTLRLARAMGLDGEALIDIYRGALLHDIGKMGVPDEILLKPSTLSAAEWEKMRQHPTFAFELLSPIPYLRSALDIPYCHHEKWDGTGYPRGLKGSQIPLSARIFAIVDVWDALRSDRAYRSAWPKERAVAYIREQSGRQFDPQVVEVFLREIANSED